jgi:hypothetical protein
MYVVFVLYMRAALARLRNVNAGERSELIEEDVRKGAICKRSDRNKSNL